ncbi:hypothetical protein [Peribacillus simplex]|uniref:Uncharacterized protein n=1 Tax=Peribacillus simplex TaxID=1478 RepID=A0A9W4KNI8_9BACI|nr:hypothetical protein [Peribacillus simplex]CAH0158000.1 hypothetical protein SRABI133_00877 [Peribacillus simplex]
MLNKLKDIMGLFFEKSESTKPFILIRYLMIILMGLIVILGIIYEFNFIKYLLILLGIGSMIDAFERLLKKENKSRMLLDLGVAFVWFTLFFLY